MARTNNFNYNCKNFKQQKYLQNYKNYKFTTTTKHCAKEKA